MSCYIFSPGVKKTGLSVAKIFGSLGEIIVLMPVVCWIVQIVLR